MVGPVMRVPVTPSVRRCLGNNVPHIRQRNGRWYAFTREGRGWQRVGSGETPGQAFYNWRGPHAIMSHPLYPRSHCTCMPAPAPRVASRALWMQRYGRVFRARP